jgi:adenylate cyclase
VLPFTNLSNDPDQDYFNDGMMEEILDRLFKIGDLKVISRPSDLAAYDAYRKGK